MKNKAIILALCLLCWTPINTPNYNAEKSEDKILYALFKDRFKAPVEVVYFLMDDMRLFRVSSDDENKVSIEIHILKKEFKQKGYEIPDVIVIIHNHLGQAYFSEQDIIVYKLFRSEGFGGKFCIYVYRTKGIYELAKELR